MLTKPAILALVVLATVSHTTSTKSCGPNFPSQCSCGIESYEGIDQYVVNCTNAGLRNTTVLENMPEETEVLIFTGNKINELPWNVFGAINDYSALKIVDMSNNGIREIRGKSYHHVQHVRRLILNHNNLSISSHDDGETNHHHPRVFSNFLNLEELHLTNAFAENSSPKLSDDLHDIFVNSNLTKLRKLHLEQNEISRFKNRQVFCELPNLRDLHLGDNNLKEINFDVKCLKNLRFLDLERNKFEYVKSKDMSLLNELENTRNPNVNLIVDFNLNPFVCDCKLVPLHDWIASTQVTVRNKENLMCFRNKEFAERIVSFHDAKCNVVASSSMSTNTFALIFLLILFCITFICLVGALVYISRNKIKDMVSPVFFDTISKKVHYTTIKDEEVPEVHV